MRTHQICDEHYHQFGPELQADSSGTGQADIRRHYANLSYYGNLSTVTSLKYRSVDFRPGRHRAAAGGRPIASPQGVPMSHRRRRILLSFSLLGALLLPAVAGAAPATRG